MRPARLSRWLGTAAAVATAGELLLAGTKDRPAWTRRNHRGRSVSLAGGISGAVGAMGIAASAAPELRAAAAVSIAAASLTGGLDDFAPDPGETKGLRGHLSALAQGEVTTGAVKFLGISTAAVISGVLLSRRRGSAGSRLAADALTSGALIAGTANLINLFDLRPGRALKVTGVLAGVLAADRSNPQGADLACAATALTAGIAPRDLSEHTMLGDTGANALGALIGVAAGAHPRARVRLGALAGVTALVLASERVSFSQVIETSSVLSWLDHLGRNIY